MSKEHESHAEDSPKGQFGMDTAKDKAASSSSKVCWLCLARFHDDYPVNVQATSVPVPSASNNLRASSSCDSSQCNGLSAQDSRRTDSTGSDSSHRIRIFSSYAGVFREHYDGERYSQLDGKREFEEHEYRQAFQGVLHILLCVSFRWCVQMMLHMAKGVALCHRAGVVHRDISPLNFRFDGWGRLKLIDFASSAEVRFMSSCMAWSVCITLGTIKKFSDIVSDSQGLHREQRFPK